MYIEIDKKNNVLCQENIENGELYNILTGQKEKEAIIQEKLEDGLYEFDKPYVCIEENVFRFLALPANFRGCIYYYADDKAEYFSSDFFVLCQKIGKVTFNYEYRDHFVNASSLPLGTTWVAEIKNLVGHQLYYLNDGELFTKEIKIFELGLENDEEKLYQKFKENFDKAVLTYSEGENALLLSGGADSRLLALVMKKYNIPFETYTAIMKPYYYSGVEDVEGADRVSKLLGVKNNIVYVEPENIGIEQINDVIEKMPFAVHLSMVFIALMEQIRKDGKNKIWAGQNADTLYNLGPSGRVTKDFWGIMSVYKRFCITEEYYQSFPQVSGYSKAKQIRNRIIAQAGCILYRRMKHTRVCLPNNVEDLINNYLNSYDYTIYSTENVKKEIKLENRQYEPHEIKKIIYNYKVKNFLKSGAPMVIDVISHLYGIEDYILPFSSEFMLPIWQDVRLRNTNILEPKKFIYRYIKEFESEYGKEISVFDNVTERECEKKYGVMETVHTAYETVMQTTDIGKSIAGDRYHSKPEGWTGVQYIQTAFAEYWIDYVIFLLENKYGVEIINRRDK